MKGGDKQVDKIEKLEKAFETFIVLFCLSTAALTFAIPNITQRAFLIWLGINIIIFLASIPIIIILRKEEKRGNH